MKKRDLLDEIRTGKITPQMAQSLFRAVIASPDASCAAELTGLSALEYTAKCHGVPFSTLSRWRDKGWPIECVVCGKQIEIDKFGWWSGHKVKGRYRLKHVNCLKKNRA